MDIMQNHRDWFEAKGDDTLALDWPINSDSLVWEIGGYEGRWAKQMANKFNPTIDIFEPQGWAFEKLQKRFSNNPKVYLHDFGLWVETCHRNMAAFETDGASVVKPEESGDVLVSLEDIFVTSFGQNIDVCLMNIEGGEFVLLPYMIGYGIMKHINYFWCQFHTFYGNSEDRAKGIFEAMNFTHDLFWNCYPTAVAWKRRE